MPLKTLVRRGGLPRIRRPASMLAAALLLALAGCTALQGPRPTGSDPEQAGGLREVSEVTAGRAMAVTANPHATRAAVAVLRAGGNAVDAAVTAQFVLNVVEPQSSGIGGGGFMVIYLKAGRRVITIDGREETPRGVQAKDFLAPDGKLLPFFPHRISGGRSVGVPGLVKMLELALRRHGTWSLARTLEPAIRLAEEGFPVSARLAASLLRHRERLGWFPATRAVFFTPRGEPLPAGALLRQPGLARSFRLLAREGPRGFYRGAIAGDLVKAVTTSAVGPGHMTLADLAAYDAVLRKPVRGTYRGYTLFGMGPPSSGATTVFQLLNLLETRPVSPEGAFSAEAVHHFVTAARLAYADRAGYLGDPDFVPVPVDGLLDKDYALRRSRTVDWEAPLVPVRAGYPPGVAGAPGGQGGGQESVSTTHLSLADEKGNLVAMTTTIEQAFGSGVVVPGWGFLLNNQLTDFSLRDTDARGRPVANRLEAGRRHRRTALEHPERRGGKRPRSSMSPTLVFKEDRPVLVVGSPGGSRIIQYVAEVLVRVLDYGMPVQKAVSAPHHTHRRGRTSLEPPLKETGLAGALNRLGHKTRIARQGSGLHAIHFDPRSGLLRGGADPRREGLGLGY